MSRCPVHPVRELQRLLVPDPRRSGTVTAGTGESITVATARGPVTVTRPAGDATAYKAGDAVTLVNGVLAGKRVGTPTVYVV